MCGYFPLFMISNEDGEIIRVEVEPSHENNTVDGDLPLLGNHSSSISPEITRADFLMAILLGFKELLTFWEETTNDSDADGDSCCDPEDSLSYR